MLTAYAAASQSVIDSVCFDIPTAKKIEADLIDLDAYRSAEPYQLLIIDTQKAAIRAKDSVILLCEAQTLMQTEITGITEKQGRNRQKGGWLKWVFALGGFLLATLIK
jgi:hypothetical protein